jgi:hypothetical protein
VEVVVAIIHTFKYSDAVRLCRPKLTSVDLSKRDLQSTGDVCVRVWCGVHMISSTTVYYIVIPLPRINHLCLSRFQLPKSFLLGLI